mgnify:FL=1
MLSKSPFLMAALLACCWVSTRAAGEEPTYKNEKYDTKHTRNVLDFWKADSSKPTPVVIYFHGGGFIQGDKSQIPSKQIIDKYLDAGVSFASCNYPFIENQSAAEYTKVMKHCGRAIQFLRSKSKDWNIDSRRFGAIGASAGALISEWLGYGPEIGSRRSRDKVGRYSSKVQVVGSLMQPMGTQEMIIGKMKRGGPPLYIYAHSQPSDAVHHPKYAKMMKAKADKVRIRCVLYGTGENGIPPHPKGKDPVESQFEFFCKYLKVKVKP